MKGSHADDPKTVRELKDVIISVFGHLRSQMTDKAITEPKTVRLTAATRRSRAEKMTFTSNAADGWPTWVGLTDDIGSVYHSFGNRVIRRSRKCNA